MASLSLERLRFFDRDRNERIHRRDLEEACRGLRPLPLPCEQKLQKLACARVDRVDLDARVAPERGCQVGV